VNQNDPGPVIRPFADFLREQSKGSTHDELSQALHDLVARVRDTGKKGSLTLTIGVELLKGGRSDNAVIVSDSIKLNLPEHDRDTSLFFTDSNGNLNRNDPNQLAFESLRDVSKPREQRDDGAETGS
jgi:hypothetical protein